MKKTILLIVLCIIISTSGYAQAKENVEWNGIIRFKPLALLLTLAAGYPELIVDWIPYINREKNGMYLSFLIGIYTIQNYSIFTLKTDIGYQLITRKGFVFTPAAGIKYNELTGTSFDLMIDIGFAYK